MDGAEQRITPEELERRLAALPALPPLVGELLASFQQEDIDVATLGKRISADQGLLARTLRIANSAFYGAAGKVMSIDHAVMVLGFRTVRSLALSAAVVGAFGAPACRGFRVERFWRHSVAVAVIARKLARLLRRNPETAFTAGLLHDLGRYVLAVCFPAQYQAVLDYHQGGDCLCQDAEQAVLGLDHQQAGAALARQWRLPEPLAAAMLGHHAPAGGAEADLVHMADILAHALQLDHDMSTAVPRLDGAVWQRAALDEERLLALLGEVEEAFEETCHALLS